MVLADELERLSPGQLQRLSAQELATLIRGLAALIRQLQDQKFETRNFLLLNSVNIRDTADHDSPDLIDLYQAQDYGWLIHNATDQVLTFRVIGATANAANATAPLGDPVQIGANSVDCLSLPSHQMWMPFVGARATFVTAPTTGTVTVIMARREWKWSGPPR